MLPIQLELILNKEHPKAENEIYSIIKIFCIRPDGHVSENNTKEGEYNMTTNFYHWVGMAYGVPGEKPERRIAVFDEDDILKKIYTGIYIISGEPKIFKPS